MPDTPEGYGEQWFVSPYNFGGGADADPVRGSRFVIHDTTLRDGEQQAGVVFTVADKVEIAAALDRLGVDRIEAGMVAVSEDDRDAIRTIVGAGHKAEIWTIARSVEKDVHYALESGVAGTGVIILANEQYCSIFRWTVEEALEKAISTASVAREGGLKTTLLIADSTRMAVARLAEIVTTATNAGVFDALSLMDTFGTLSPTGARRLVTTAKDLTDLPIELHPHNDFGLGTANALAGIGAGASVVHTSMLGLGERVGNTPLEELAVAAPLLYDYRHGLDLGELFAAANLVQERSGVRVAANKPVIGPSYSQIESGTVASEYARWSAAGKDLQWLFPFVPSLIGAPDIELVIGKGSGLANIEAALTRAGLTSLGDEAKQRLLAQAKQESIDRHRALTGEEFALLASSVSESLSTS